MQGGYALLLVFVLAALLRAYIRAVNIRYMLRHQGQVPLAFAGYITAEKLHKAMHYAQDHARLGLVQSVVELATLFVLLYAGPLRWLDTMVQDCRLGFVGCGLLYFYALLVVESLLSLPFSLWSTFVVEQRHGFNRSTLRLWLLDQVKGLLIGSVLFSAIGAAALALMQALPQLWWLAVWAVLSAVSLLLSTLAPVLIAPLFNRFEALDDAELNAAIVALARRAGVRLQRALKVDASKRSRHSNAYFTGMGKTKRVVLYDTLIAELEPEELLAVLAHELGHWRRKHVLKRVLVAQLSLFVSCLAVFYLLQWSALPGLFFLASATIYTKLVLVALLLSLLSSLFGPLGNIWSRMHERQADDEAMDLVGDGQALARALMKLARDNLANIYPHPIFSFLYYSHPPVVERVERLLKHT